MTITAGKQGFSADSRFFTKVSAFVTFHKISLLYCKEIYKKIKSKKTLEKNGDLSYTNIM